MVRPTKFEISESQDGATRTITVAGELDLSTIPALAQCLDGPIDGRPLSGIPTVVRIDLRELEFMDSSGLRLLIELNRRAEHEGWTLTLVPSRHEAATAVLKLTGADDALPFEQASSS